MLISIRPAVAGDEPMLWEMLFHAARMAEDGATAPDEAKTDPFLARFVEGFGHGGDLGSIAVDESTDRAVGAAWVRVLSDGHGNPDSHAALPELAIAVLPEVIGQGIGTRLMLHLLDQARGVYPAIVLSVRDANSARRLYERLGFVVTDEIVNRVGGKSLMMRLDLDGMVRHGTV